MAFKKQLVTSCKQAIWGEILGGNAPNYAITVIIRINDDLFYNNFGINHYDLQSVLTRLG